MIYISYIISIYYIYDYIYSKILKVKLALPIRNYHTCYTSLIVMYFYSIIYLDNDKNK